MTTLSTHDTKRGEDVRARIAVLAELPERVGATRSTGCSTLAPLPDPGFGNLLWQAVVGAWPVGARAAARVRREGDARGRRPHHLDRPRRGVRGGRARRRRRGVRRRRRCAPCSTACVAAIAGAGLVQRARRQAARADDARACPTSTRAPSCGTSPWSTPTTGGRSTSTAARARGSPATLAADDDDGAAKLLVTAAALRLRRDRPELFTRYTPVAADGRGRRPRARLRPRRRGHRGRPGCRSAWPRAAAGATPRCGCPPVAGATC